MVKGTFKGVCSDEREVFFFRLESLRNHTGLSRIKRGHMLNGVTMTL